MVQLFLPDVWFGVVSSVTEGFRAHVVACEGSRQVTWPYQQTGYTKVTFNEGLKKLHQHKHILKNESCRLKMSYPNKNKKCYKEKCALYLDKQTLW